MLVYVAGPLFSEAERNYLEAFARALRDAGLECFLPHEHEPFGATARHVFELDHDEGLAKANALVAWVDGPTVDDGTACEIGIFWGLMQRGESWRKGILALATDDRLRRRGSSLEHGGLNLFLAGLIERAGGLCWSVGEAVDRLLAWKRELEESRK
jgi:hypothetical protein